MNARRVFSCFILIAGLALCGKGLWMLFSPRAYEAVVKIEIESDVVSDVPGSSSYAPYDPYFMETEFKRMEGGVVLSNVVQTLNQDVKWGKQEGKQLGVGDAIELLRQRMDIDMDRNTKIVEINVWDKDPDEAAQIANAIAEAYRDYRINQHKQQMGAGIEKLEEAYQAEETNILLMQSNVDQLREKRGVEDTDPNETAPTLIMNAELLRHLNEKLIEQRVTYILLQNHFAEFQSIQATNPTALADVLLTVNPDDVLSNLLIKLHDSEQKLAAETNQIIAGNPDRANTQGLIDQLKKQIDDRAAAMMFGLQVNINAQRDEVLTLSNFVQSIYKAWDAKRQLQDALNLHQMLAARIEADKEDALVPKTALVTVVEPAVPPKVPVAPNRWLGGAWLLCGFLLLRMGFRLLRNGVKAARAGP
jgi:uncharacterized protein involved in exopolysaccharide biosynthesis